MTTVGHDEMNITEITEAYGNQRAQTAVGDTVLIEGTDSSNGVFVIVAEIRNIKGTSVEVFENSKFCLKRK